MMSHLEKQRSAAAAVASSGAVAGKTARPCDGCARRRARWYCAADDAFLCQSCDSTVHSANPLARRHQRLRLKTSSSAGAPDVDEGEPAVPSWLWGFKRKARTPRPHHQMKMTSAAKKARPTTVPELVKTSVDETEDEDQQLLYRVPVFDPALAEFRSPPLLDDSNASSGDEAKPTMELSDCTLASTSNMDTNDRLAPFLPSDMELAEFAANMESLLGGGLDGSDDSFSMEKLGLVGSIENNNVNYCLDNAGRLKTEQPDDAEHCPIEVDIDMTRETLELDFDWPGSSTAEEDELGEEKIEVTTEQQEEETKQAKLRLDYEAIISAWSSHGSSPWTDGERPQINLDNCWIDYMGMWAEGARRGDAVGAGNGSDTGGGHVDVGRQARVTRYREKRRTRLFAKKIRYEVRKLNAEKRPRMKGRFVKRAPGVVFVH
ncbi:zinc finger protein CONSTANS-LIKE 16-like [Canna indica]|uniref:Zinc finger protein CONSTANS-LIKE 16-like n=1 Tax=Canna indica TaxID=4628 RepID=A0AAQ3JW33_9LILI|nr:zinc finger protein CONSTANS-LIKE 16-like [Canna indica]